MAKCKELLLLKKPIVWQLDQPERVVNEHEFDSEKKFERK
mgnify:CR=1 FL=1